MAKDTRFEELGRVQVTDTDDVVVSLVYNGKDFVGWSINKYRRSDGFTGFMKGLMIPDGFLDDFLAIFEKERLQ